MTGVAPATLRLQASYSFFHNFGRGVRIFLKILGLYLLKFHCPLPLLLALKNCAKAIFMVIIYNNVPVNIMAAIVK